METGSINYSPDYKSEKRPLTGKRLIAAAQKIWDDSEAAKERARLEREVIEAARPFANDDMDKSNEKIARHRLQEVAKALIQFEAQQK